MDGVLLIDKPEGWTSHDVVAKVRGILRSSQSTDYPLPATPSLKVKVGHTGTLDPMASGLMILVLGKYTKRAAEFSKLDKTYEAQLTLGATSSTADREGEITKVSTNRPAKQALQAVLSQFEGKIQQTPPIYSAVKIGGQRAYKMARKGQTPKMEPRQVTVYSLQLTDYDYPIVKFTTSVSSGTYIRSLAVDIGEKLGTGAYLSALRRTKVANYSLDSAINIDKISKAGIISSVIQTALAK